MLPIALLVLLGATQATESQEDEQSSTKIESSIIVTASRKKQSVENL
jgi:hypothetical protein